MPMAVSVALQNVKTNTLECFFIITSYNPDFNIVMEGGVQQLTTCKHLVLVQPADLQATSLYLHTTT